LPEEPLDELSAESGLRPAVLYQPPPLKTSGGAFSTRRAGFPHFSHGCSGGLPKDSRFS
jgi:hypothetical protein